MISATIRAKFESTEPVVTRIQKYVKDVLLSYCANHNGSAFLERLKTVESLSEKLESGRYGKWSDVDDLYGATLVIPTLLDEVAAHSFIRERFYVVEPKLRGETSKSPQEFRFDSPRFKCKLRAPSGMDSEPLYQQLFEIQTRTAFEHAWSVTTHKLSFKARDADWRTQRVAAQLRASVEQLDNMILAYDHLVAHVTASPDNRTDTQVLIVTSVSEWRDDGLVPSEAMPASLGRLSENVYALFSGLPFRSIQGRVQETVNAVNLWLRQPGNAFPRSLSVFQLFLGVGAKNKLLSPRTNYSYLVSDECRSLFPDTAGLTPSFSVER